VDLDDGTLYPDQNEEFEVLLDFAIDRGHYPAFRKIQLEALRISGVKHRLLQGSYSRAEIRAVYRKTGAFLMAHAEAFGLPICELQACGAKIFMADPHWAAAHWIGEEYHTRREPRFTANFVVYENDPAALAQQLVDEASSFDPKAVRQTFIAEQGRLFRGDREELSHFLEKVRRKEIHSRLHHEHWHIGRPMEATQTPARVSRTKD
jgi:glycosyltransferase involved in cell wall biosynthesis